MILSLISDSLFGLVFDSSCTASILEPPSGVWGSCAEGSLSSPLSRCGPKDRLPSRSGIVGNVLSPSILDLHKRSNKLHYKGALQSDAGAPAPIRAALLLGSTPYRACPFTSLRSCTFSAIDRINVGFKVSGSGIC